MFEVGPGAVACVHKELLEAVLGEGLRFHFGMWGRAIMAIEPSRE
ncbi:MAG: hypothetical protein ACE148_05535 [Vicinamibacterales bacterium]